MRSDDKLFFFSYYEDTRKITVPEGKLTSLDELLPILKEKYKDKTVSDVEPDYWTADQTYGVRHKITTVEDIYPGAVIEVKYPGIKRENNNQARGVVFKRPRKTGPRYAARLRGLPWGCTKEQVVEFFSGINLEECHLIYHPDGRASGEGIVEVGSESELQEVLAKNKESIGSRYIEVRKTTASDIDWALQRLGANGVTAIGGSAMDIENPSNSVIRMRGLPFTATETDIEKFLAKADVKASRVHLIRESGVGRPSGIAYVEVASDDDVEKSLTLNRESIGSRYIELYKSSQAELKGSIGGVGQPSFSSGVQNFGGLQLLPGVQGGNSGGNSCIRMRGLPWQATEQDIIVFFREAGVIPVRIHLKSDGGEAYVEFADAPSVAKAMTRNKEYIGHRYVELFPVGYGEVAQTIGLGMPFQQFNQGFRGKNKGFRGQYRLFQ